MLAGKDILTNAGILLNDIDHTRWPVSELAGWLREGIKAVILAKPEASSESRVLQMAKGTLQQVPTDGTPTPLKLLKVVRNVASANAPRGGGRAITTVDEQLLDSSEPNWHDERSVRFRKEVRNVVFDDRNPLEFYCYPGNDGTGLVEVIMSTLPEWPGAGDEPESVESYTGDIGLPEPFSVPLLDYVLYRAQLKDDTNGSGGRSTAHYQQFASAVGLKIQVDRAYSPNGATR